MNNNSSQLKAFSMTYQLIEHDLGVIEDKYGIDLGRNNQDRLDEDASYYPQIEQDIRGEAAKMAPHYEIFYSLEKTIRRLVSDTVEAAEGVRWWTSARVPQRVRDNAEQSRQKEIDSGVSRRSEDEIDYCTFGELGEIIKTNWDIFSSIFTSVKAMERVMSNLNTLRNPIAHCSPLAEDEVTRLRLAVRDWFRLME
jgi:hypothetical protein